MRTDVHRAAAIEPVDYEYVAVECMKVEGIGDIAFVLEQRRRIERHMAKTGGTYSSHAHGGNCHCCGAHCIYTTLFYHAKTNSYIRVGSVCAGKLDMGNAADFRTLQKAVKAARDSVAGKKKAQATLADLDLSRVWDLYVAIVECRGPEITPREESILFDMCSKLVKYGSWSDSQANFARKLLNDIDSRATREASRAAEKAAAKDAVSGRVTITGEVLKVDVRDSQYGIVTKMTVKTSDGWLCWGTVPSSLEIFDHPTDRLPGTDMPVQRGLQRGDKIELTATFTVSDNDPKFAFFKRPIGKLIA